MIYVEPRLINQGGMEFNREDNQGLTNPELLLMKTEANARLKKLSAALAEKTIRKT